MKNFIKEDVQESLHELVRGNVITAARYYHVEFQDRGAGHIHGTLWLNLKKIENMVKDANGD